MRARLCTLGLLAAGAVAGAAAPPLLAAPSPDWRPCSRVAGAVAAREAGVRQALARDPTLVEGFGGDLTKRYRTPWVSLCGDFDGDGHTDRALLYSCCTTGAPAPFVVLRGSTGPWRIVYARLHDPVADFKSDGTRLVTTLPKYKRGDESLCCPSQFRIVTLRWTGTAFKRSVRVIDNPDT